jgi:uncharacterized membrane protein
MAMWRRNEFLIIWPCILILVILLALGKGSSSGVLGAIRLVIGCLFIAFVPGYALAAALLPKPTQLGFLERISISFALSIAVLSVMALILDRLPWGISLWPSVVFLVGFSLLMTVVALIRRSRLPDDECSLVPLVDVRKLWQMQSGFERLALGVMAGVVLIGAIAFSIVYARNHSGIATTEFYMLSPDGLADYYPSETTTNVTLRLGIGNYEHKPMTYTIHVFVDGQDLLATDPILVSAGQRWENDLAIPIPDSGNGHRIDYQLFRSGDTMPYRSLRLEIHSP